MAPASKKVEDAKEQAQEKEAVKKEEEYAEVEVVGSPPEGEEGKEYVDTVRNSRDDAFAQGRKTDQDYAGATISTTEQPEEKKGDTGFTPLDKRKGIAPGETQRRAGQDISEHGTAEEVRSMDPANALKPWDNEPAAPRAARADASPTPPIPTSDERVITAYVQIDIADARTIAEREGINWQEAVQRQIGQQLDELRGRLDRDATLRIQEVTAREGAEVGTVPTPS